MRILYVVPLSMLAIVVATTTASPAQTFTTLVNFNGTNGANGGAAPIQGKDGNLYGTTGGGANNSGIVYKMTPTGTLTTIYSFCAQAGCTDGSAPAGLLLGADGNFYGLTINGGSYGYGTVFTFTKGGTLTTLHSFDSTGGEGANPFGRLVQGSNGSFYGSTAWGGNLPICVNGRGCGTIFQITPSGTLTTLYDFCSKTGCADGAVIFGPFAQATDGNLYGATYLGGRGNGGTIFKITPGGTLTTLFSFCVQSYPFCEGNSALWLVLGTDGNFYGTTILGGNYNQGTFFKITPDGTLTTIYSFCTKIACRDGAFPRSGPILGSDGNFYGTTYYGGTSNLGTVYKITPSGVLTTLHSFRGTDGNYPINELFQASNGDLYGTTTAGGTGGLGTIYRISVVPE